MGKQYGKIEDNIKEFINQQKMFFVGTAANDGRVNVSPKGMDTFRVIDENRVLWLNLTGSGNETAAHIIANNRITIMFCAFEGKPNILRLYGKAKIYHPDDDEWSSLASSFPTIPGSRQIFDVNIDLVQTSCGFAVPFYEYMGEREELKNWAEKQGEERIHNYWHKKNSSSIDGMPTDISS